MKMKTWKFLPIMAMGVCMAMTSCSEDSKKEDVSPTHLRVLIPRTVALQQMMN